MGCSEKKIEQPPKPPVVEKVQPAEKPVVSQKATYLIRTQIENAEGKVLERTLGTQLAEARKVLARTPSAMGNIATVLESQWISGDSSILKQLESGQNVTYKGRDGKDATITTTDYKALVKSGELDSLKTGLERQRRDYVLSKFYGFKTDNFEVFRFGGSFERCHNYNEAGKTACSNALDRLFDEFKRECHPEYGLKGMDDYKKAFIDPKGRINETAGTTNEAWVCWKKDNKTPYKAVTRVPKSQRGR